MTKDKPTPELMARFLRLCPDFSARWEEHVRSWDGEARGDFNDIVQFAHFIVDRYAQGCTGDFPAIFSLVEQLLSDGDERTKGILIIGLIEGIQNIASHRDFGAAVFVAWLGPVSRTAWAQVNKMWEGKSSLMDVVRDEAKRERDT